MRSAAIYGPLEDLDERITTHGFSRQRRTLRSVHMAADEVTEARENDDRSNMSAGRT